MLLESKMKTFVAKFKTLTCFFIIYFEFVSADFHGCCLPMENLFAYFVTVAAYLGLGLKKGFLISNGVNLLKKS